MASNTVFEVHAIVTIHAVNEVLAAETFITIEALKEIFRIVDETTINNIFAAL